MGKREIKKRVSAVEKRHNGKEVDISSFNENQYYNYNTDIIEEKDDNNSKYSIKKNNKIHAKDKRCCVVIPSYKPYGKLDAFELLSLKKVYKTLDKYDIYIICPMKLDIKGYSKRYPKLKFSKIEDKWFVDQKSYSDLCEEFFFYQIYEEYEYMLIYQLDAYVFKDELKYWCNLGYDYIGSPHYLDEIKKWKVGNGGFSLRKISTFLEVSKIKNTYKYGQFYMEDRYFTEKMEKYLDICPIEKAFRFGALPYEKNTLNIGGYGKYYGVDTFGFHGMNKYDYKITLEMLNSIKNEK